MVIRRTEILNIALFSFLEDEKYHQLRDEFFEGNIYPPTNPTSRHSTKNNSVNESTKPVTFQDMFHRIDSRLRRIVIKACLNSAPASKVIDTMELFLVHAYTAGKMSPKMGPTETWDGILLEPPTLTHRKQDDMTICQFFFDPKNSTTGGFYRLLLHSLCQFHGLKAISSTLKMVFENQPAEARVLTSSGFLSGADIKLVESVMKHQQEQKISLVVEAPPIAQMNSLRV